MRLLSLAAGLMLAFVATGALAADPVRVEILSVQEQAGRLTATIIVYGPDGQPVTSLPSGSVRAALDNIPLPVTAVHRAAPRVRGLCRPDGRREREHGRRPDNSGSPGLSDFLSSLDSNDQVALMSFDTSVRTVQEFTADKAAAIAALNSLTPKGDTALYDAVIEATKKAGEARTERKLVIHDRRLGDPTENLRTPSLGPPGLGPAFSPSAWDSARPST
jgi:hypothetical protein